MSVRGNTVIRASANLTTSYVAATVIPCKQAKEVVLLIGYTMGTGETANTCIFKVDWSVDAGTTYFQDAEWQPNSDAVTNGAVTVDKNEFTYAADSAAATYDYFAVPLKVKGYTMRASFKESGVVTNAGTAVVYAVFID